MNSLSIYVEENLLFSPEKCYEEEINTSDCNNKNISKEAINVPLILPQSTMMDDRLLKPCNEQQENDSVPTIFTANKTNAKPFLQEKLVQNSMEDRINCYRFMELCYKNLTLHIEIAAALNQLFESFSVCNKEQTPKLVDFININTMNICGETVSSASSTYSDKNIGINNDIAHVQCPVENVMFTPTNQQLAIPCDKNFNLNAHTDLSQTTNIQNSIGNIGTMNSNFLFTNNGSDTVNQSLEDQIASVKSNVLPKYDKFVNTFELDQQNYFENSNTDSKPVENSINNEVVLKETNPFRLSLAGKIKISDSEEDFLYASNSSVIEHDLINFESNDSNVNYTPYNILHDCKDTSFNDYQWFNTDSSNDIKTVENNPFALSYDSNVKNITNRMSEINIGDELEQYNAHQIKVDKERIPSTKKYFPEISTSEIINENFTFVSYCDTNNLSSSTSLPANSLETPTSADTANIDEGYFTHLNTSKEYKSQTIWKNTNIPEYLFTNYIVFFQLVELPNEIVHVFHHQEEGWLLTDEFIKICTKFQTDLNREKLLYTLDSCFHVKKIDKTRNLIKFLESSSTLSKATQDIMTGSNKLRLVSLNAVLKILHELEIASEKDISDAFIHEKFTNGSIAHKIWLIINAYKQLKKHVESGQTHF